MWPLREALRHHDAIQRQKMSLLHARLRLAEAARHARPARFDTGDLMKTALVCGVSGQDGAYLAKLLLEKGYRVVGTSRDAQASSFTNLERLSILDSIERESMLIADFRSTLQVLKKTKPDEVYNLA